MATCSLGDVVSKKFFSKRFTVSGTLLLARYFFCLAVKNHFPFSMFKLLSAVLYHTE